MLKAFNQTIQNLIDEFIKKARELGKSDDEIKTFLSTLIYLISSPGREDELKEKLDEKIRIWSKEKVRRS